MKNAADGSALKIYILFELRVKSEVKTANKRDES